MKRLYAAIAALMSLMLASCISLDGDTSGSGSGAGSGSGTPADLTIVAATELKDLQGLVDQAAKDLGFSIDMQFPGGTLDNSQTLKRGDFDGEVDATWFATNRYVNLIGCHRQVGRRDEDRHQPRRIRRVGGQRQAPRLGQQAAHVG